MSENSKFFLNLRGKYFLIAFSEINFGASVPHVQQNSVPQSGEPSFAVPVVSLHIILCRLADECESG